MALDANLKKFNAEISVFISTIVPNDVVSLQKKLAFQALERLVNKTRVDTGRARGNYQVSINQPMNNEIDREDRNGGTVMDTELTKLSMLPPYQIVYIANSVPYIEVLESWDSMFALTLQELRTQFK